ncbi:protein FAM78B-like [Saccoglossus kowalevskii]|uniref:Protein FAM78A-like n=1 Tax=Saccoglossus kowalevskii TaxID=10224 RepID=A0ABM0GIJ7_SACKO|nr:PREDICTED: protein FAM78A-like [Saccoglossus kowalevskii]
MGCILAKKTQSLENGIKVYELYTTIDRTPTVIDEYSPTVLKYRTPHFRASAKVRFPPIWGSEVWQVGWVQVCTDMNFINTYGEYGYASWEIPVLKYKTSLNSTTCISDSDGRSYPWYGATSEVATIEGPTSGYSNLYLRMNDNFHPTITWDIPVSGSTHAKLTNVTRDQSFTVWLLAFNRTTGKKIVLKTIRWRMQLEIAVDPKKPLKERTRLASRVEQHRPEVLKLDENVPDAAFHGPNANEAQMLAWYPKDDANPVMIVPPKHKMKMGN